MKKIKVCPYLEACFEILGRRWNGLLLHYLALQQNGTAHFSDMKNDLEGMTSRSLSLKLQELASFGLIEKQVSTGTPVTISYALTEKGRQLADALQPVQEWAQRNIDLERKDEYETGTEHDL